MTKIQHVETQVALANGQSSRLQTSTFSLLCMPNTDPIRCDSGWFPKSLLTYPTLNLRSPPSCLMGIGAGWLKEGRAKREAIIEQCDAYLRLQENANIRRESFSIKNTVILYHDKRTILPNFKCKHWVNGISYSMERLHARYNWHLKCKIVAISTLKE